MKLKNNGALATKIYIKTNDGRAIPFLSMDDLKNREEQQAQYREWLKEKRIKEKEAEARAAAAEEAAKAAEEEPKEVESRPPTQEDGREPVEEKDPREEQFAKIAALTP